MSYLVIARKYRPQNFSDIIGQEHVTRTLQNAIEMDKISHAYLFTGPRGVGKTTTARILAKAVNCQSKKGVDPCNKCIICKEITSSESVDVIEIDAASNRGIDEIRELRKNVKFAPSSGKYKVYIIDEVHMLTKEAFNAILKTLEEPPEHVIFIMATTEPEKVLDTISSRCQTFHFRLLDEKTIVASLKDIAKKEKVKFDESALFSIATSASGSMRDAQSIMDQALSYTGGKLEEKKVDELIGLIPKDFLFEMTGYIQNENTASALKLTDKLVRDGYNLNRLFNDLLKHFRDIMLAKVLKEEVSGILGIDKEYSKRLNEISEGFTQEKLVWLIDFMTNNSSRIKYASSQQVIFDAILFKLCQKYVSYDDIVNAAGSDIEVKSKIKEKQDSENEKVQKIEKELTEEPDIDPEYIQTAEKKAGKWGQLLEIIKDESLPLYHQLKESSATLKGKIVTVKYTGGLELTERQMSILKESIVKLMGEGYYPKIVNIAPKVNESVKEEEIFDIEKPVSPAQIEKDEPLVREIVEQFEGRIEK